MNRQDEEVPATLEGLVKPHIESFDYFLDHGIQEVINHLQPAEVYHAPTKTTVSLWLEDVFVGKPLIEDNGRDTRAVESRMFPRECRVAGTTYYAPIFGTVCLKIGNGDVERQEKRLGRMPIMVRSSRCHLRTLTRDGLVAKGEESTEFGGYFICNGIERVVRLLILPKKNYCMALRRSANSKRGPSYSTLAASMRCVRSDMTSVTVRLHYLTDGRANLAFSLRKREYFIPAALLLKALVDTTDREIYDKIVGTSEGNTTGEPSSDEVFAAERAELMLTETSRRGLRSRLQCLAYLGAHFRDVLEAPSHRTDVAVGEELLQQYVFIHLSKPADKFNLLLFMIRKLYALASGGVAEDNPDSLMHHDLMLPGHLMCMAFRERCNDFLTKWKSIIQRDLRVHPETTDLTDLVYLHKCLDTTGNADVFDKIIYMLNTGNLVSVGGLDLSQVSGFTVVADKLNFVRYISHFRSVHRGAFFMTLRTTAVRKLLPESWGFMCPVHTPDGSPCGLLNHLSRACAAVVSTPEDPEAQAAAVTKELVRCGLMASAPGVAIPNPPSHLPVLLDGKVVGSVRAAEAPRMVAHMRTCKVDVASAVPEHTEVGYLPPARRASYPGIFLFTGTARMVRPVVQRAPLPGKVELVGPFEQVYLNIHCPDGGHGGSPGLAFTHEETGPTAMFSMLATLTPWSDYNQSPRNMYQCQMAKQTMGTPLLAHPHRLDNKLYRIQTPQSPLARNNIYKEYEMDEYPAGTNAVVAVLSYTGYDMEDAMMINKSSMERGLMHASMYKCETLDLAKEKGDTKWAFGRGSVTPAYLARKGGPPRQLDGYYEHEDRIDQDGLPRKGARILPKEAWCSMVNTATGEVRLHKLKGEDPAFVDSITVVGGSDSRLSRATVKFRYDRNPIIGDKFSSRHGQKGTLSLLYPDVDMPFCLNSGIRPDIIINPHAFPSRMTIGMIVESLASKAGAQSGTFTDSTPFKHAGKHSGAGQDFEAALVQHGFARHGNERMVSGVMGTEMDCDIFIGCVYYQRLRHMVSDKFQVRSIGPVNKLTHQPVKGRKFGGGIRFGEMERDSLLAHGAAFLLHDRLHSCSDRHIADVCRFCGSLISTTVVPAPMGVTMVSNADRKVTCRVCDSTKGVEKVALPYVFKYLAAELAAMNIRVKLSVSE